MTTEDVLTLTEAARELGISRKTATKWANQGRLRTRKLGPVRVVRRRQLNAFRKWYARQPAVAAQRKGDRHETALVSRTTEE